MRLPFNVVRDEPGEDGAGDRRLEPCDFVLDNELVLVGNEVVVTQSLRYFLSPTQQLKTFIADWNFASPADGFCVVLTLRSLQDVLWTAHDQFLDFFSAHSATPLPRLIAEEGIRLDRFVELPFFEKVVIEVVLESHIPLTTTCAMKYGTHRIQAVVVGDAAFLGLLTVEIVAQVPYVFAGTHEAQRRRAQRR